MLITISIERNLIYIPIFIFVNFIFFTSQDILDLSSEFKMLIRFCSEISLIICYFIQKYLSRNESNSNNKKKVLPNPKINNKIKIIFYMIVLLLIYYYCKDMKINNNGIEHKIYIIMFLYLIDLFIFQRDFYSHQILSLILLMIGICYYMTNNFSFKLLYLIDFMSLYCRAFEQSLVRYLSINYFINIFLISFSLGFIGLIYLIISRFIKYDIIILFPNSISFTLLLYIICNISRTFLYFQIIDKLGPIHVYLSDLISYTILNKLFLYFDKKVPEYASIDFIIILILLISMLIYFEIVQLNFCGLNKNTKKQVLKRSENDSQNINLGQSQHLTESINIDYYQDEI